MKISDYIKIGSLALLSHSVLAVDFTDVFPKLENTHTLNQEALFNLSEAMDVELSYESIIFHNGAVFVNPELFNTDERLEGLKFYLSNQGYIGSGLGPAEKSTFYKLLEEGKVVSVNSAASSDSGGQITFSADNK